MRYSVARGVAPRPNQQSYSIDSGASNSVPGTSEHPGLRLLCQEMSQTAIADRGCSKGSIDSRGRPSSSNERHSTYLGNRNRCVLQFLLAQWRRDVLMHQQPVLPVLLPDARVAQL
jgi:hypothetical protein